jgi:phosphoglycerate-specific signal transduction histidine kinase
MLTHADISGRSRRQSPTCLHAHKLFKALRSIGKPRRYAPTSCSHSASIRQHTSAYVGICQCQHVSIRQHASAHVSIRQHTSAYVSMRQHTSAYVSIRQHTSAYVSIRQHTSAYVSIRQHTSAYVSIRQYTSAYVSIRRADTGAPPGVRASDLVGAAEEEAANSSRRISGVII